MARYQILHCQPHRNWMLIMVLKMRDFTFIPSEAAKEPGFQAFRTIISGSRLTLELRPKSHELLPKVARMQISMSQNTRWDTVSINLTGTSINHLVTPWWVKSPSIYHGVFYHHHHCYHYFYCFCFFFKDIFGKQWPVHSRKPRFTQTYSHALFEDCSRGMVQLHRPEGWILRMQDKWD